MDKCKDCIGDHCQLFSCMCRNQSYIYSQQPQKQREDKRREELKRQLNERT